jgi:hypothetical protein
MREASVPASRKNRAAKVSSLMDALRRSVDARSHGNAHAAHAFKQDEQPSRPPQAARMRSGAIVAIPIPSIFGRDRIYTTLATSALGHAAAIDLGQGAAGYPFDAASMIGAILGCMRQGRERIHPRCR